MAQSELNKKLALFLGIREETLKKQVPPDPELLKQVQKLKEEAEKGNCHGWSILYGAMRRSGSLTWWGMALDALKTWDGSLQMLKGKREEYFELICHYMLPLQGKMAHIAESNQYNILRADNETFKFELCKTPESKDQKSSSISTVEKSFFAGGHFDKQKFIALLSDKDTQQHINHTGNIFLLEGKSQNGEYHTCNLWRDHRGDWWFFDPNYPDETAHRFDTLEALYAEVIRVLGNDLAFELEVTDLRKIVPGKEPFSIFDSWIQNNTNRHELTAGEGYKAISRKNMEWAETIWTLADEKEKKSYGTDFDILFLLATERGCKNFLQKLISEKNGKDIPQKCRDGLILAAKMGHVDTVEMFLKEGVDINYKKDDKSALDHAIENNRPKVVSLIIAKNPNLPVFLVECAKNNDFKLIQYLLQNNIAWDVNAQGIQDWKLTILHFAAYHGNLEVVKWLHKRSAILDCKDKNGRTPLDLAIEQKKPEVIEYLAKFSAQFDPHSLHPVQNKPWIIYAAEHKKSDLLTAFLKNSKANVDVLENKTQRSLLHFTCQNNDRENTQILLNRMKEINAKDAQGKKPLDDALEKDHPKIVQFFLEKDPSLIVEYARNNNFKLIQYSSEKNIPWDVNVQGMKEWKLTPLHYAASLGNIEMVKFLHEKRADLSCEDKDGRTALDLAIKEQKTAVIEYLAEFPAAFSKQFDPHSLHPVQNKPWIIYAAEHKKSDLLTAFLKNNKANVDVLEDKTQHSLLHFTCQNNDRENTQILLNRMKEINAKDAQGKKPLDDALEKDHPEIVRLFIAKNPSLIVEYAKENNFALMNYLIQRNILWNVNIQETENLRLTPLHYAVMHGKQDVVAALLKRNADLNRKDAMQRTPLDIAFEKDDTIIIEQLLSFEFQAYKKEFQRIEQEIEETIEKQFPQPIGFWKKLIALFTGFWGKRNNARYEKLTVRLNPLLQKVETLSLKYNINQLNYCIEKQQWEQFIQEIRKTYDKSKSKSKLKVVSDTNAEMIENSNELAETKSESIVPKVKTGIKEASQLLDSPYSVMQKQLVSPSLLKLTYTLIQCQCIARGWIVQEKTESKENVSLDVIHHLITDKTKPAKDILSMLEDCANVTQSSKQYSSESELMTVKIFINVIKTADADIGKQLNICLTHLIVPESSKEFSDPGPDEPVLGGSYTPTTKGKPTVEIIEAKDSTNEGGIHHSRVQLGTT